MIFYFNADGSQLGVLPEKVYQGSNKASTIYFVCPTHKDNIVCVAFTLPDGTDVPKEVMSFLTNFELDGSKTAYCYKYDLPLSITSIAGNVNVQFYICNGGGEITSTAKTTFYVERGVNAVEPEKGDSYLQVLTFISDINSRLKKCEVIDSSLSKTSTNSIQNKVVSEALDNVSAKTLLGLTRLEYEGNEDKFTWLPQVIQDEITAGTSKVIFGLDRHDDKVAGALPSDGRGSMVFVERTYQKDVNLTDTKIDLLIDGDIYVNDGKDILAVASALDGKVNKIIPSQTKNTTYVYAVQRTSSGAIYEFLKEMSASVKVDVIPITGAGGTLRIGNPTVDAHAVTLGYMNANIGHRYKFTAEASARVPGAEGTTITFYHDTKSQFDLETLAQELNGKDIIFSGHILPLSEIGVTESTMFGAMSPSIITVENSNVLTITVDSGNGIYLYTSGIMTNKTQFTGTLAFSVEQIY